MSRPRPSIADIVAERRRLQAEGLNIHNCSMGNPGLTPTEKVKAAFLTPSESHDYGLPAGEVETRRSVSDFVNRMYGLEGERAFTDKNAVITFGATGAIASAQRIALKGGGKTSILIAPFYASYLNAPRELADDAKIEIVQAKASNGWLPAIEDLRAAFLRNEIAGEGGRPTTSVGSIVLNYPNNPTGAVLPPEYSRELKQFLEEMEERYDTGIMVILDNAYLGVAHTESHSIIEHADISPKLRDNIVIAVSASKALSAPDYRVGAAISYNAALTSQIAATSKAVGLFPNPASQRALRVGFDELENAKILDEIGEYYYLKALYVKSSLDDHIGRAKPAQSFVCTQPEGGIFLFANLSAMIGRQIPEALREAMGGREVIENDIDINSYLMNMARLSEEQGGTGEGLSVLPGCTCGMNSEDGWVRICISGEKDVPALSDKILKGAMDVVGKALLLQMPERLRAEASREREEGAALY